MADLLSEWRRLEIERLEGLLYRITAPTASLQEEEDRRRAEVEGRDIGIEWLAREKKRRG